MQQRKDHKDSTTLPMSSQWLQALADRRLELEKERDQRTQRIQELYDQIYPLWTRLGITEEVADDFIETWKGCEMRCIAAVGETCD